MGAAVAETVDVAAIVKAESTKENRGTARRKMHRAIVFGFLNNTVIFSFIEISNVWPRILPVTFLFFRKSLWSSYFEGFVTV